MMTLITGGSKCGKSALAEQLLADFSGKKYYLATMMPFGEEAEAAIRRHQEIRKNKYFQTIEKYTNLQELVLPQDSAVLLECMGNLCANEMFQEHGIFNPAEKILNGVVHLRNQVSELVIVTNQVGSDGIVYPTETMQYIRALGKINQKLAELADTMIECVYGIPVIRKGGIPC